MYGPIPKETLAEVLLFLVENEKFESLKQLGTITPKQFRDAIVELAEKIKTEANQETSEAEFEKLSKSLKKPIQEIISKLTVEERERLFKGFLN